MLVCCAAMFGTFGFAGPMAQGQQTPSAETPSDEAAPQNGNPARPENIDRRLENISKQVGLTEEQKEKIRPLLKSEFEKLGAVRSNPNLTQGEARRRVRRIRRATNQQIAQILTPEQRAKWQELREEHRGGPGAPPGPGGQTAPPSSPNPQ